MCHTGPMDPVGLLDLYATVRNGHVRASVESMRAQMLAEISDPYFHAEDPEVCAHEMWVIRACWRELAAIADVTDPVEYARGLVVLSLRALMMSEVIPITDPGHHLARYNSALAAKVVARSMHPSSR